MHGQAHMWCLSTQVEQTAQPQRIKTAANEELREAVNKHRTAEPRDEETLFGVALEKAFHLSTAKRKTMK